MPKKEKVNQQGKARKVDTKVEKDNRERCGGTDNLPAPPTMDHPELFSVRRHSVFSQLSSFLAAVTHECNSTPLS